MLSLKLVTFLSLLTIAYQKSTPESDSYVAGVLEYEVRADVEVNLYQYERFIKEAALQDVDVLVFPEMTLTRGTKVPVPIHGILKHNAPADVPELFHEILVRISKAARESQMYVLINIEEEMNCTDTVDEDEYCPDNNTYYFNTNVVFDRNGFVIDRYRKIHLFGEYGRTPALRPELGTFTTDFGVTFGHYICFDLMFQVPAIQVVEKLNITDVLFSTMWFSEMPYLTAVQIQEAYAYAMNINFIASGANNVRVGSAGSGIYSAKQGALASIMPGLPDTQLLVARVPKVPGQATWSYPGPQYSKIVDHDNLVLISDPSLPSHVTRLLVPGYQEFTLVDKDVTCRFRIRLNQTDDKSAPQFRAIMHDGSNTYARQTIGTMSCSVVACKNESVTSCPYRYTAEDSKIIFEELEMFMTSPRKAMNSSLNCDNIVYFPSSMRINKFPLEPVNYTYIENAIDVENSGRKSREHIIFKINAPQNDLLSFDIWGRDYTKDVDDRVHVTEEEVQKHYDLETDVFKIQEDNEIST